MAKRGKALIWTEKALEEISEISEADREAAAVFWEKNAPIVAKEILNAETLNIQVE